MLIPSVICNIKDKRLKLVETCWSLFCFCSGLFPEQTFFFPSFLSFFLSGKLIEIFSLRWVMGFRSNFCHIFHRLGAGAGRVAAGVPGCGGGAEVPDSEQQRIPAHLTGGQKPHGARRRQRRGGLGLQWVAGLRSRWCLRVVCSWRRGRCPGWGWVGAPWRFLEPRYQPQQLQRYTFNLQVTSLHSFLMTVPPACTGMNCNYG